jgi:hypothetical protein
VNYKFQLPKPIVIEKTQNIQNVRQRSGSADYSAENQSEDFTHDFAKNVRKKRWFESDSIASINLESSLKLFHEDERPMSRVSSRQKMFDGEKGFLSRKASLMKMNLSMRRNTVG